MVVVPVNLSKPSDAVKNDFVKKYVNAQTKDIEDKMPDIINLASNILKAKINEV